MLRRGGLLLVAGLVVSACAAETGDQEATETATAQEAAPSADEAAIDQLLADYVQHYNMHHADIVAGLYTDSTFWLDASGAVYEGRAEIQASTEAEFAMSPTVALTSRDKMVFGDNAIDLGEWSVNLTANGAPASLGGAYLTYLQRVDGQWKVAGGITNYNAAPTIELPAPPEEEAPPNEGTMQATIASWTQAFGAGDWAALSALYTNDAIVSFSQAEILEGNPAIQARFQERFGTATSQSIEIHDVGTMDLADGWALDGGWYTMNRAGPEGAITQTGMYMNLMQRQPDGTWRIHRAVSNGNPAAATN